MRLLLAVLVVFFILGWPGMAVAEESAAGVIDGQLILQTENGRGLAEVDVTLLSSTDEMGGEALTTKTDGQGRFQFTGLATASQYMVLVHHEGIDYYYPVVFEPGVTKVPVKMFVWDTTTSDEAVRVKLTHVIIDVAEESISVTQILLLVNDGDRTCVSPHGTAAEGQQSVLVFTLPEGASDFHVPSEMAEGYLISLGNRVADTLPFPPGERDLAYSYRLAKGDTTDFTLNLQVDYPTDRIEVMVEGGEVEVASTQLRPAEPVDTTTGERFIHLSGENLPRGATVDVCLCTSPRSRGIASPVIWVIGASLLLGVGALVAKKKLGTAISGEAGSDGDADD